MIFDGRGGLSAGREVVGGDREGRIGGREGDGKGE